MFSFISLNWKGKPLENYESVVKLISSTKTKKGLKIKAMLDKKKYKKGHKVSDEEFDNLCIKFHKKISILELCYRTFNVKYEVVQVIYAQALILFLDKIFYQITARQGRQGP